MTSERHARYLDAMGIDIWCERGSQTVNLDQPPSSPTSSWQLVGGELSGWLLNQSVSRYESTESPASRLAVVCEAVAGESQISRFSPEAAALLEAMLNAIQLSKKDIAFAELSAIRDPNEASVARVLSALPVKAILFMGALPHDVAVAEFAARNIPNQTCNGVPLIVSVHPEYLLANPAAKRAAWEDLKQVRSLLEAA